MMVPGVLDRWRPPRNARNLPSPLQELFGERGPNAGSRSRYKGQPRRGACTPPFCNQLPTRSNDVEVLDALAEVPVLRFLALQLDLQPDLVGGIGEAQRVLVADAAGLVQVEEGLGEGLHAKLARLLHDLLDLVDLALEDQVGDQWRVEQYFDRRRPALALAQRQQALRDHRLEVQRQVHQQLLTPLLGEEVDDAVHRLVGVAGVQRAERQVAGL